MAKSILLHKSFIFCNPGFRVNPGVAFRVDNEFLLSFVSKNETNEGHHFVDFTVVTMRKIINRSHDELNGKYWVKGIADFQKCIAAGMCN